MKRFFILVIVLGLFAIHLNAQEEVFPGADETRIITLINLSWDDTTYTVKLDEEIGIESTGKITLIQLHPTEKVLGVFNKGDQIDVSVMPFRAYMLLATTEKYDEPAIKGADYRVLKNVDGQPVEI